MDVLKFFSRDSSSSKNVAKERLQLVLVHDRTNCSPKFLEMIKEDILNVISGYMEIDEDELDISISKTQDGADSGNMPALMANIPIKRMKTK